MKIKLPLRVEETGIGTTSFYHVIAFDGMFIGMFPDQQTAQLFADCFEAFATARDPEIPYEHYFDIELRATEAVEE